MDFAYSNILNAYPILFQIRFSAKLHPNEKATFHLKYEEQLKRINGFNHQKLHLHLKNQKIKDFNIKINITETLPLKEETIVATRLDDGNELMSKAKLVAADIVFNEKSNPHQAIIGKED